LGLAIRLAYSIGLNRSSVSVAYSETAWPGVGKPVVAEMCKRIWWQVHLSSVILTDPKMYVIEVEIALDSGRPMCIRNSDIDVELPVEMDDKVKRLGQRSLITERQYRSDHNGSASGTFKSHLSHRSLEVFPNYPNGFESGMASETVPADI